MQHGEDQRGEAGAIPLQERPLDEVPHEDDETEIVAALGGSRDPGHADGRPGAAPTTRELLAEVASRAPHAPHPPELERRERRFVRWLLGGTLLACALLLGILWWLDPISVTGRQTRFSVVENGGVRQAKLDLMQDLEAAPEVLILGSSRSMKLDPEVVEETAGVSAFNGAVSGGTSQDMYLYARYAEELWAEEGEYPHLVLGVVNDVLRFSGTAALDPRLKKYLPRNDRDRAPLEVVEQLLQLTTLEAGARAAWTVGRRDGWDALLHPESGRTPDDPDLAVEGRQKGNQVEHLTDRGMQEFDPVESKGSLKDRVDAQMTTFIQRAYEADAGYRGVDQRGLDLLRRTIRTANEHGDVPTLWVTPYHPDALAHLPEEYEQRDARFRAAIRRLQREPGLRFEFLDLDDLESFGGDPHEFHDGIHMTEANTAKVIEKLHEEGLLAPRDRRG